MKKGYYIKKAKKDNSIYLHICKADFIEYLNALPGDQWVKFRIYERDQPDSRGFTHNMEVIQNTYIIAENSEKTVHE
jgi:CTP:phosphocholine cytidylyltransferase-like protein